MTRRDAGGDGGEERDFLELHFAESGRIWVPGRADRARLALRRRREPAPFAPRRRRVAADQDARPQGGHRPGQGAARALLGARAGRWPADLARLAVAAGDGGAPSRTRRRSTSCARRRRSRPTLSADGRWTGWWSATSATARPRWRCARRSRPISDGHAGRRPRADDRARGAAPRDVPPALRGLSVRASGCCRASCPPTSSARSSPASRPARSTWSSARTGCCPRTSGSATWASSSSTRSSASASPTRSGSSSCAPRSTC